jgi:TrmH family RNA methyltransferase
MALSDVRVVLVHPRFEANIGSVARAMHNFGLTRLVIIAPAADHLSPDSRRLSTHGEFILHQARVVHDLDEAIADCSIAAATSSSIGGLLRGQVAANVRFGARMVIDSLRHGPAAIVFGPEASGLTNEEIARCQVLLHIPASTAYPVLNLAQAVAVTMYELHLAAGVPAGTSEKGEAASLASRDRVFAHLRLGLEAIHFLYGPKADTLMHAVRHILERSKLTEADIKILHGLARQLEWIAGNTPPSPP